MSSSGEFAGTKRPKTQRGEGEGNKLRPVDVHGRPQRFYSKIPESAGNSEHSVDFEFTTKEPGSTVTPFASVIGNGSTKEYRENSNVLSTERSAPEQAEQRYLSSLQAYVNTAIPLYGGGGNRDSARNQSSEFYDLSVSQLPVPEGPPQDTPDFSANEEYARNRFSKIMGRGSEGICERIGEEEEYEEA